MAAAYGWVITRDVLEGRAVTIVGPADIAPEVRARLQAGEGRAFRMRDDDRELYYEGRYIEVDEAGDALSEWAFGPLDDFGAPDSGCTSIEYLGADGVSWEVL